MRLSMRARAWLVGLIFVGFFFSSARAEAGGGLCDQDIVPSAKIMGCATAALMGQLPHSDFCGGVDLCRMVGERSESELRTLMSNAASTVTPCQNLPGNAAELALALAGTGAGCAAVLEAKPEIAQGLVDACRAADAVTEVVETVATAFADGFTCSLEAAGKAALYITECSDAESEPERSLNVCLSPSAESHRVPARAYRPAGRDVVHSFMDRGWISREGCSHFDNKDLNIEVRAEVCSKVLEQITRPGDTTYSYDKCGFVITDLKWRPAQKGESAREGLHLEADGQCVNTRSGTIPSVEKSRLVSAVAKKLCTRDEGRCDGLLITQHGWEKAGVKSSSGDSLKSPTRKIDQGGRNRLLYMDSSLPRVVEKIEKMSESNMFL